MIEKGITTNTKSAPILKKLSLFILIILIAFYGASFLIPLIFAGTLALVVVPVVTFFKRKKFGEFFSISIAVGVLMLFFIILFGTIFWQGSNLNEEIVTIKKELVALENISINFLQEHFGISKTILEKKIKMLYTTISNAAFEYTGAFTRIIGDWFLTLVYLIVILMERERIKNFILKMTLTKNHVKTKQALSEMVSTVNDYLYGHLKITLILIAFYSIGFMLAGLKFSIVLAILAAVLTIIPYLGNIIGLILVIGISLISSIPTIHLIYLLVFMGLVQFIESYFLKPWIIGNEISLNIMAIIISVVVFSMLWGVSGSILALPLTSIIRIICSKARTLKPYEYLLNDSKI